jgi:hypothetical protein
MTSLLIFSCLVYPLTLLKSESLQLLGQSYLTSWLPMFRCHTVVLVWLRIYRISFGRLCGFYLNAFLLIFWSESGSPSKLSSHPK